MAISGNVFLAKQFTFCAGDEASPARSIKQVFQTDLKVWKTAQLVKNHFDKLAKAATGMVAAFVLQSQKDGRDPRQFQESAKTNCLEIATSPLRGSSQ